MIDSKAGRKSHRIFGLRASTNELRASRQFSLRTCLFALSYFAHRAVMIEICLYFMALRRCNRPLHRVNVPNFNALVLMK